MAEFGIPITESRFVSPGTALIFGPGALKQDAWDIAVNPSDVAVILFGYRPLFSRYTLGARELQRERRRFG